MSRLTNHHIKSIYVRRLFGRYTYRLPIPNGNVFGEVNILYAENGRGKTTLLHLVFHLLSAANNRGHKTIVGDIPFERLEVTLQDGSRVTAEKDPQILTGPTMFKVEIAKVGIWEWRRFPNQTSQVKIDHLPENVDFKLLPKELHPEVKQAIAQREYFKALAQLKVEPFILTSDRILLADSIEPVPRRRASANTAERALAEAVAEQRKAAVTEALRKASDWLSSKLFEGVYRVSSVSYENVVQRIATTPYKTRGGLSKTETREIKESLFAKIDWINEKSENLAKIGAAGFSLVGTLRSSIENSTGNKLHLIDNVLTPHLDELRARVEAIWPTYELVAGFTSIVNRFFSDKEMTFKVFEGLKITSSEVEKPGLEPGNLSSGEQQLMLIFCHVLTSREKPSIFIIDEPEISLNIAWQRMLVSSLDELAGNSKCQFLFASHSLEILAKHSTRVLEMARN